MVQSLETNENQNSALSLSCRLHLAEGHDHNKSADMADLLSAFVCVGLWLNPVFYSVNLKR